MLGIAITLVVVGMVLIAVDFYLPGFVLGTVGGLFMVASVGLCWREYGFAWGIFALVVEISLAFAAGYASVRYVPQTATGRRMILATTQKDMRSQQAVEPGLVGRTGVAQSYLRPTGVALIEGQRREVMAESGLIESGSPITVVAVQNNRIIVRKTG
jgi:membrane-bound serine protease (ClpP class)